MMCPHCKFEFNDSAQFCSNCGRRAVPASHDAKTLISSQSEDATLVRSEDATLVRATVADSIQGGLSSASLHATDPLIGVVLDSRYHLTGHVGHGGMGTVYRARRLALGDDVAVKILHRQFVAQPQMLDRFRREARAAAMLHHPNIVAIYDFGDIAAKENNSTNGEGVPAYIVMELLQGETLGALLKREGKLAPKRAVRILREVCAGVGAAHAQGTVHRDLKPDNIIVQSSNSNHAALGDEEGDEDSRMSVKVVDFGIAKLRDMTGEGSAANVTHVGTMLGTPSYMSPEQCRGEHLDARADVYSLGAITYELLTGRTPFTAPTVNGVIAKHLTEAAPPLRLETNLATVADPELAARLDAVIRRALAKEPTARQADATGFARELTAALRAPKASGSEAMNAPSPFTLASAPVPVRLSPAAQVSVTQESTIETEETNEDSFDEPPKRTSRIGITIGLLLVAIIAAGASGLAWMLYVGSNSGGMATTNRRANTNTNQRPRPSPTPTLATPTPTPTVDATNTNLASPDPSPSGLPANLPFDPTRVAGEIGETLEGWTESTRDHDIDSHMDYYAPQLENFYRQPNADRSVVRTRLQQAFDQYDDLDIRISNLRVQLDQTGQTASAFFDKKWRFEGKSVSRGAVRQEIKLRKIDDRWMITSERDLRVYPNGEPLDNPQ